MTYWYGKDYESMGFIFFVVVFMIPFFLLTFNPIAENHNGLERTTISPQKATWLSIDGDCPVMELWLEQNPQAWYQDEKILRYNFLCEDNEK